MTLVFCLLSFIAGGVVYHCSKTLFASKQSIGPQTFASLLETAAHKFLVHANHAHIGDGAEYCGDLEYAKKLMAEAQRIKQADEDGHGFLQLTDGKS